MNSFSVEINSESELPSLAKRLLEFSKGKKVFLFYGEMGSGKTTFIKTICETLGVKNGLSSPTYSIINEYISEDGEKIYHFDLYRLKNLEECVNVGMEDYLFSGHYCFIEWPELAEKICPDEVVKVKIFSEGKGRRVEISL